MTSKATSPQDTIEINLLKFTRQMVTYFGREEKNSCISGVILLLPTQRVSRSICCFKPCYLWIRTGAVCEHKSAAQNLHPWQHFVISFPTRRHRGHWIMQRSSKRGRLKCCTWEGKMSCMNICWGPLSCKWAWQKRTWARWTQAIMFSCHKQG